MPVLPSVCGLDVPRRYDRCSYRRRWFERAQIVHRERPELIGQAKLHLDKCSRWPERQTCGQETLQQVEASPEDCLVWNIVAKWYEGKKCVFCHKPVAPLNRIDLAPALLGPDFRTTEWKEFSPKELPKTFSAYQPVCWNCRLPSW